MRQNSEKRESTDEDVQRDLNCLIMMRGEERYLYLFADDSFEELVNILRSHASDPELSLNWLDAALLIGRARAQLEYNAQVAPE